jgi:heat shock protein HtpX
MNKFKTFGLMAILTLILIYLGGLIGGQYGALMALVVAGVGNFISYYFSDKLVLKAYRAQELPADHKVTQLVRHLADRARLPMPKVYLIPQDQPNAFATGRNPENAAVAVTRGLVNHMNEQELSGVLAHELGHIANRDILIGTIAATLAGAISYLGYASHFGLGGRNGRNSNPIFMIMALILAPLAASLIRMAISRTREYKADAYGATVSGNPAFLSSALARLENYSQQIPLKGNDATSHMFIVHPFKGRGFANLFSTHPSTAERIKRLNEMSLSR